MTEFAPPQRAGLDFPHDKHGNRVAEDDEVQLVYMGSHHRGSIGEIAKDDHGVWHAAIDITIVVPCTALSRREDENPDDAPAEGSPVEHRSDEGKKS